MKIDGRGTAKISEEMIFGKLGSCPSGIDPEERLRINCDHAIIRRLERELASPASIYFMNCLLEHQNETR